MASAVLSLCLTCPGLVSAQGTTAPTVVTPGRLAPDATPPVIDGKVDDAAWESVVPHTTFTQQDPRLGEPATERTEVRLLFAEKTVYVSFICFDADPSKIIMSQARRDASLAETDSVILIFDTFNDNQNAFVFGTNPLGIEYDGQVAREGQSGGVAFAGGAAGTQRGGISAFNPNWDGDWVVRAQVTERGWEAEMAIPLKTLRYATGDNETWGFNVLRNIRHKNEQVYLAMIPRGFDIYRISLAAKVPGLKLPPRRDIKIIPYVLGSANKDFSRTSDQLDRDADVGVDLKWGVTPSLTIDVTVNTDFAQVEADEEQVNLTRFDLFFPEKRPFFLENASTFQFGQPQAVDLFFSRRIGLSGAAGTSQPIDILGGGRLSGKVAGSWNVGLLNIQTNDAEDFSGRQIAADTNFSVLRAQKEVGRSSYGAIFVGQVRHRRHRRRAVHQVEPRLRRGRQLASCPPASGSPPTSPAPIRPARSAATTPAARSTTSATSCGRCPAATRRSASASIPRSASCRAAAIAGPSSARSSSRSRRTSSGFAGSRRTSPTTASGASTASCSRRWHHIHPFEVQPMQGGRFGWFADQNQDNPLVPFVGLQPRRQPRGDSARPVHVVAERVRVLPQPERRRSPAASATAYGNYYDGDFQVAGADQRLPLHRAR